jgi:hypothetical protein
MRTESAGFKGRVTAGRAGQGSCRTDYRPRAPSSIGRAGPCRRCSRDVRQATRAARIRHGWPGRRGRTSYQTWAGFQEDAPDRCRRPDGDGMVEAQCDGMGTGRGAIPAGCRCTTEAPEVPFPGDVRPSIVGIGSRPGYLDTSSRQSLRPSNHRCGIGPDGRQGDRVRGDGMAQPRIVGCASRGAAIRSQGRNTGGRVFGIRIPAVFRAGLQGAWSSRTAVPLGG